MAVFGGPPLRFPKISVVALRGNFTPASSRQRRGIRFSVARSERISRGTEATRR
jgi:hypothetical protein